MKHIPKGVLPSQPELCFPIKCAHLHLGRPVGAPRSSWQMSCISGNAVFPAFSSAAFSTSRQTSNQLMPRHEANELLRPRLLKEQDVPLWYRAFHVTGCVPEWSRPYLPLESSPSCVVYFIPRAPFSVKGEVSLWLCN